MSVSVLSPFTFHLLQWNIADYLFQNRDTICGRLEGLRPAGNKTGSETRQSGRTDFEKSIQVSSLPVVDLLWMYMFRSLSFHNFSKPLQLSTCVYHNVHVYYCHVNICYSPCVRYCLLSFLCLFISVLCMWFSLYMYTCTQ